jgi:hypothetical protein
MRRRSGGRGLALRGGPSIHDELESGGDFAEEGFKATMDPPWEGGASSRMALPS